MVDRIRPKRRIMRKLRIDELSSVDRPAQSHARMTLMKRADEPVAKDYYPSTGGCDVAAVARDVQALDFKDVLAADEAIQATYQVKDDVWRHWNALQRSFETIAGDESVTAADKVTAMRTSLNQFIASLSEETREDVAKSLAAVPVFAGLFEKDEAMTAAEKQQLNDLKKKVDALVLRFQKAQARVPAGTSAGGQFASGGGGGGGFGSSSEDRSDGSPEQTSDLVDRASAHLVSEGYPKREVKYALDQLLHQTDADLSGMNTDEVVSEMLTLLREGEVVPRSRKNHSDDEKGDEAMTAAEKQQLAELQKTVAKLTKDLEVATSTDQGAKAVELTGALETADAQVTELTEKLAKAEAASAEAVAKAGMSDAEKAHMAGMPDEEKKAFLALSTEDRAKKMKKSVDEDPVVYKAADGTEFRKSVGDAVIALAKRADESDKRAIEETRKREDTEYAKRADDDLKPFAESVAKRDDKIEVLRAIDKMEAGPKAAILKMLEVGGKAISAAFESIGGRGGEDLAKSALTFEKHVSDIMARDKITKTAAMSKARVEHPEAFAAYREADGSAN